jgi:hypothetical protein
LRHNLHNEGAEDFLMAGIASQIGGASIQTRPEWGIARPGNGRV